MALLINNEESEKLLDMRDALNILEAAFREEGRGAAVNHTKHNIHIPTDRREYWYRYCSMEGGIKKFSVVAIRIKSDITSAPVVMGNRRMLWHAKEPGLFCGLIYLYSAKNAELLAILNDGYIQHVRVGATAGLAAKRLAPRHARVMGLLGTGGLATTHAEALAAVRPLTLIKVYSPNPVHRREFAERMSKKLGIEVRPLEDPRRVVESSEIVATCTDSLEPVLKGEWIEDRAFVTTVSGFELDAAAYKRVENFAYYQSETAGHHYTTPPSRRPPALGVVNWAVDRKTGRARIDWEVNRPPELRSEKKTVLGKGKSLWLPALLLGQVALSPRGKRGISLFMSEGSGVQFAACAFKIYEEARRQGLGRELPAEWFLQTIRN
jgi:ornithine cyclodeaminase/alanine dehydrogenase-like protein (mu-crystallin family)